MDLDAVSGGEWDRLWYGCIRLVMEQLLEFRFDFDSIRLIEIESISFEIIENFSYCPALNRAVKCFMQSVNKHSKTKKNFNRVTV